MQIAKTTDGTIVQIMKFVDTIAFAPERGWFCICVDFHKPQHKRRDVKWVPASTRFVWTHTISIC
jgi:hypothetical protein